MLRLNTLKPAVGAKQSRKRLGRGVGSGLGKTSGKGHKGQTARAGGYHKVGFEGGQSPMHRRLPKLGFRSWQSRVRAELRLDALNKVQDEVIDEAALRRAKLVPPKAEFIKIILRGELLRPVQVKGLALTKGARAAIVAAGGSILESDA